MKSSSLVNFLEQFIFHLLMIQPSNLLPNCAEGSLAKKDTFLGQVGLHGPDFESNTCGVNR